MSAKPRRTATHCPNGHLWADGNLYINPHNGYPKCRACNNEDQSRWWQRHGRKPRPGAGGSERSDQTKEGPAGIERDGRNDPAVHADT